MSLGSSDMAGSALGTAFSLLLLASIIQGFQDLKVFHYEKMEAVVGQAVALPCTINTSLNLKIVNIEWSKNLHEITKLAVYSQGHGEHLFWPNVSIQIDNKTLGSHLYLRGVSKWDSGVYTCEMATFPLGSIRRETQLEVKDAEIKCDANSTIEVHAGENVTIHCTALLNAQYRWTKNKKLVSENESLELSWVTDAHRGAYILTVNTGNKSLQKEFTITVLTATTSFVTDRETQSAPSNVTEEGLIDSTHSSPTTSPTPGLSTADTNVTWSMGTDATDVTPNPSNVTTTPGEHINDTHISVTSTPATHTDTYHFNTSTDQEVNATHASNSTFSDQSVASNPSTTPSYGSTEFRSTQETRNESMPHTVHAPFNSSASPEESSTLGSITENSNKSDATPRLTVGSTPNTEDTDGARSHLLLLLIIVPVLVLIAVAGFIYRKQMIQQRMDLPPSFKPPPPPVKYTAARQSEISTERFPTSRCNSLAYENRIITPDTLHIDR
ncbi:uncharacterized protein [Pagrus major]|uniref:uncharacterized protein n=1 Tax=Pagrus major TaxID=143350 RepID=UPI003CC8A4FE